MTIEFFEKIYNKVFLILPVFLIIVSMYLLLFNEPSNMAETLETWKTFRNLAGLFYLFGFMIPFFFFAVSPNKNVSKLGNSYKYWVLGVILSVFSFTIGSVFVDLAYLGSYFIFPM